MTPRRAAIRIAVGLFLLVSVYTAPWLAGYVTAGSRLEVCPGDTGERQDLALTLSFVPGPTELGMLQGYGRYGGSGGDMNRVILLRVSPENRAALSRLYWIDRVAPADPCPATAG